MFSYREVLLTKHFKLKLLRRIKWYTVKVSLDGVIITYSLCYSGCISSRNYRHQRVRTSSRSLSHRNVRQLWGCSQKGF